jgi:aromatic-L-amino-acid/L-tryptophan decarboxylase
VPEPAATALELTPEQMRSLGYAAVDALVEDLVRLGDGPAFRAPDARLRDRIEEPPPEQGTDDPAALLAPVMEHMVCPGLRPHHPGMMAYVPSSPTFPGAVGAFLAAGANVFAGTWQSGPGAALVELTVLGWFRDLLGLDPAAEGVITSGGSMSNLSGLAVAALCHRPDAPARVAYVSDQVHSSVTRALRLLGIGHTRVLPSDGSYRLHPAALAEAAAADRAAGRTPWCVAASAGTTNTGAVDDLPVIAALSQEQGLWLHVDGAYGGFAALTTPGTQALRGMELADSLVLDAHKWLYAPLGAGVTYIRQAGLLERTFAMHPEYLRDAHSLEGVDFADRGPELSRPFRALTIWLTVKTFGVGRIRAAIAECIRLASVAAAMIERSPELELVTGPELSVVTFRSARGAPVAALVDAVAASGSGFISSTSLRGVDVARLCVLGHRTGQGSVEDVIRAAAAAA